MSDPVDAQTGWVYRSDATPKPTIPAGAEPADLSGIIAATAPTRPVDPADGIPPSPPVVPGPPEPEPRLESRSPDMVTPVSPEPLRSVSPEPMRSLALDPSRSVALAPVPMAVPKAVATPAPPQPSRQPAQPVRAASQATRSKGWIESGLYVMTLPIAITAGIMYAPVAWFLSGRSRG